MELSFEPVTADNIKQFQQLLRILFPVAVPPSLLKDALSPSSLIKAFLARRSDGDRPIGCVCWRSRPGAPSPELLYLGVLVLHRRAGIGAAMLRHMESELGYWVTATKLKVHSANGEAVAFYEAQGFEVTGTRERYYPRLEPPDAVEMRKELKRQK